MSVEQMRNPNVETDAARGVMVEFLFLDLTACTRCVGTERNLERAVALVTPVLEAADRVVQVRKVLVESAAHAHALRLVSSPTIRVNGRDIVPTLRESTCGSCSALSGTATACRVWEYQGQTFTESPVGLLVEMILRGALGAETRLPPEPTEYAGVPDNLQHFFDASERQAEATTAAACCSPNVAETCCLPTEKAACCGTGPAAQCGCR
jgi:hypothetical protein